MGDQKGRKTDWREETSSDLAEARSIISGLLPKVSGDLTEDQVTSAWTAYVLVEKSVFFIKVELDDENPGRFINVKPYVVPDERQALGFAMKKVASASEEFALGDLKRALKELREGRNYLRVLLMQRSRGRRRSAEPKSSSPARSSSS